MRHNGLGPPGYPGNLDDDPDFLDVNCVDYGLRMRTMVSAFVFGVGSWAILIAFLRRMLGS